MSAPRRVHVTGGSGFLGGHVIPLLLARGYEVSALARSAGAAARVAELGATPVTGDLDDAASIEAAFTTSGADALVNLASLGFGQAPAIVKAAAAAGLDRGVFVSSTAIFTTLDVPSKARRTAGEDVVTASDLDWTVIRPTMIYGAPGDRNLSRLLSILPKVPVLPVPGGGTRLQQPVHVDDLAVAIVNALENPATIHQAYNVAGPEAITFRRLLEDTGAAAGRRPRLLPVPLGPTIAVMRQYERVASHPKLKVEQLERLSEDKAFDISDARRDLGFAPRSFADGIAEEARQLAASRVARPAPSSNDSGAGGASGTGTAEHFDEIAASWIRRYADRPSFRHRLDVVAPLVGEVLSTAAVDPAATGSLHVLDFGGGPGVFSLVASERATSVVCLDVSAPMVEAGATYEADAVALLEDRGIVPHPGRVARVVGSLDTVSDEGDPFDVVLAIAVLEYLPDPDQVIIELAARLRDGGRLMFTVPNERSAYRRVEDLAGAWGATAGRLLHSERLRSRAYATTRPHGNRVPWRAGAGAAGLVLERVVPLRLAPAGALSRIHATQVIVMRKRAPAVNRTPERSTT
jgi:uncharacterized protein YbjT (DUF2867 family)/2-polyprenyl-3-methyl-5-hydroxy-6-metoxy-1,4-benzoquinol methylase